MLVEVIITLAAIVGVLLAVSALVFHFLTRGQNMYTDVENVVDAVTDLALEEINKMSQIIFDELNEKYKSLLFIYNLMDDKQAKKAETVEDDVPKLDIKIDNDLDIAAVEVAEVEEVGEVEEIEIETKEDSEESILTELNLLKIRHPRFEEIRTLMDDGLGVDEISKRLKISKGEIQLIVGFGLKR